MSSQVRSYTRGTSPLQGDMVGGVVVVVGMVGEVVLRNWWQEKPESYRKELELQCECIHLG